MISNGLYNSNLRETLLSSDDIYQSFEELLEMIDFSESSNACYSIDNYGVYGEDEEFVEWLYCCSNEKSPELADMKRELLIKLGRAKTVDEPKTDETFFVVGRKSEDIVTVWTKDEFLQFKQGRLRSISSISEFSNELQECFENIFFDERVEASLHTLKIPFNEARLEIVEHLHKLDLFYSSFVEMLSNNFDYRNISKAFTSFSGIECSPQNGRDKTKALEKEVENQETGKIDVVVCELHTKFVKFNRDIDKQDRMYFYPGNPKYCNGKIIVLHIGKHL